MSLESGNIVRTTQDVGAALKVVINSQCGAFGLSEVAIRRYHELKCVPLWVVQGRGPLRSLIGPQYWLIPPPADEGTANEGHEAGRFLPRDLKRNDPLLVQVVEELGERANGLHASLKIVEIPDGIEWEVCEFEGDEWIAEKHRTWR